MEVALQDLDVGQEAKKLDVRKRKWTNKYV
jgi:hypothetical protein